MSRRKLEALRNLAERPGTEAEGRVARAMLAKHETAVPLVVIRYDFEFTCNCGTRYQARGKCPNVVEHARITVEAKRRFPKGRRIYYNCWAYPPNCAGTATGYVSDWNWVRVKFDHLKSVRNVPAYKWPDWLLSTEPLPVNLKKEKGETQWN